MKDLEISHAILVAGADFQSCRLRVERFFARTLLVRYDEVEMLENEAINAKDPDFAARLNAGLVANKQVLGELLENLKDEGFNSVDDLWHMEKGYLTKILHMIAHMTDGFIGIDSRFYNLEEDSHGVSRGLYQKIAAKPEDYWLFRVKGRIAKAGEDPLDILRTFEGRAEHGD